MGTITVASLHFYPVKSCRGHAVTSAPLDRLGFVGDRRFLVTDAHGRFLTQRTTPLLARITPTLASASLELAAPDHPSCVVATAPGPHQATREVVIWRDTVRAVDLGDDVAYWLTAVLGQPARLVQAAAGYARPMGAAAARPGDEVAFVDGHPLLVISEASLDELNQRLDFPLPMNRFRPSLVVRGAEAFAEDRWHRIRIGEVVLRASGPCGRCVVTTTDQESLERGPEPLRTLALYRRGPSGDVNFGQNYIHETKSGAIAVGAEVTVLGDRE